MNRRRKVIGLVGELLYGGMGGVVTSSCVYIYIHVHERCYIGIVRPSVRVLGGGIINKY